jgi:hypothetical protein
VSVPDPTKAQALSRPFAQSETQPTTENAVVGCATGSARLLSAHNWGGLLSLYFGLFLYQGNIVATVADVSRRFLFQMPAQLLRIPLPRTPVNKQKLAHPGDAPLSVRCYSYRCDIKKRPVWIEAEKPVPLKNVAPYEGRGRASGATGYRRENGRVVAGFPFSGECSIQPSGKGA